MLGIYGHHRRSPHEVAQSLETTLRVLQAEIKRRHSRSLAPECEISTLSNVDLSLFRIRNHTQLHLRGYTNIVAQLIGKPNFGRVSFSRPFGSFLGNYISTTRDGRPSCRWGECGPEPRVRSRTKGPIEDSSWRCEHPAVAFYDGKL